VFQCCAGRAAAGAGSAVLRSSAATASQNRQSVSRPSPLAAVIFDELHGIVAKTMGFAQSTWRTTRHMC
jgi:hypothetical protein